MPILLGMPDTEYFAHPALSSTGVRRLLDSPARFRYLQQNPPGTKKEFDLGHAVHAAVLRTGAPAIAIPEKLLASNGAVSTAAAKEWVEEQRALGLVPVKQAVADQVNGMTEAVLGNSTARQLLEQEGNAEASVFARDPQHGFEVRARFDFLPAHHGGRRAAVDLKTTSRDASPSAFAKVAADHGYDIQQEWYLLTERWATGYDDLAMVFVVVEAAPPYLVAVHQLDREFIELGQKRVERARAIYADCLLTDKWPGYEDRVFLTPPPMWLIYRNTDEENQDEVQF